MRLFLTTSIILFCLSINAQKIKYKKGKVKVDETEKYIFDKIKGDDHIRPTYQFKDMSDALIFEIKDAALTLPQLPYESKARMYKFMQSISIPTLNMEETIPYMNRMNARKFIHKVLEKTAFYKTGEFNNEVADKLLSELEIESVQATISAFGELKNLRATNYEASKIKFGEYVERDASQDVTINGEKINCGGNIGKIKEKEKGKIGTSYEILNTNKELIATLYLENPEIKGKTGRLVTIVDEKEKNFKFEVTMKDKQFDPTTKRQIKAMKYLVDSGYL